MKKTLILIVLTFLVTGCSVKQIDNKSVSEIVGSIIKNDTNLSTRVGVGYNYYMPTNVSLIEVNDNNEILYSTGVKYYLYVDLISYQKQVKATYKINKELYLSKVIKNGKKTGYIEIDKIGNQYYIEMMYNYSKVETYVYKYQLKDTIINISYILSSISYNETIIDSLIANKTITSNESVFTIYKPTTVDNNYIENTTEDAIDTSSTIDDPDVINVETSN